MLMEPTPESSSPWRQYVMISVASFLFVAGYLGWVFYSRWADNQALEQKAASEQREQARQSYELMGGNRFAILGFYADSPRVRPGESVSLCYSVSNAKSVTLVPQSEPVWPAYSRCVNDIPKKTTTYTLTAVDAAGNTKTATVTVAVR